MNQSPGEWVQPKHKIRMHLDSINKKLLYIIQAEFPLTREPYTNIGHLLGTDGNDVICRIERLKAKGIVRQIGPVLDARRIGYQPTLVAMRVSGTDLDKVEQLISQHRGVSHGYERDHYFNLWFTLAVPPGVDIATELAQLTSSFDAEAIFTLPAVKVFKIGAYFDVSGDSRGTAGILTQPNGMLPEKIELSHQDKSIIRELQQDLPLVTRPFTAMASQLDITEELFLERCQALLRTGVMRRFAASISHTRAGFKANAMACWVAPPGMVNAAGLKLASMREVSHCYERQTNPLWLYNLFAMIHGHTKEACWEIANQASRETGLRDYVLLFSTKEFKKTRVKYLA